jgi:hypothetical protein
MTQNSRNYREFKAINYSSLQKLSISPYFYKKNMDEEIKETDALILGDVVDCLLTSKNQFRDRFAINLANHPTGLMGTFVEYYKNLSINKHDTVIIYDKELVEKAYNLVGFKRDNLEKITALLETDEFINIFKFINESIGKKILSDDIYNKALSCVDKVSNSIFFKYFITNNEDYKNLYQYAIYWDKDKRKSLLDIIHIDKLKKEFLIIDVKTTSKYVGDFKESINKYRYDIQASYYTDAFKEDTLYSNLMGDGYTFLGFRFLLINTNSDTPIVLCDISNELYNRGKYGGIDSGKYYKGYEELIKELNWHIDNDLWDYPYEVYKNNNCFIIN